MEPRELQEENRRLREQNAHLLSTLEEIRHKLTEPDDVIRAISKGEVDALVVREGSNREEIYALQRFSVLHEREEQNRLMVEGVKDHAIFMVDLKGCIVNWNSGAVRIFGYSAEEIIGQNRSRFFTPEDVAAGVPQRGLAVATEAGYFGEESWRVRKDGSRFWAEVSMTALHGDERSITGFVMVVRDLTERRRAKQAMHDTAERLRIAVRAANIGLWDWNLETNQVQFSAEWKSQIGYGVDEVRNEFDEWKSRVHPDDLSPTLRAVERFLASPTSMYQAEFRLRHRDGSYRWILAQGSLSGNESGTERHMVGCHIDISDRVASESALRLRDRAIQSVSQGIVITDPRQADNPIVYANPAFLQISGYEAEEVIGRNCRFLQGVDTDRAAVERIRDAVRDAKPCKVEVLNYRKDGKPFWNDFAMAPVTDEGGVLTHFVGVQTDVTERRSLEAQFRQAQKMEAFGQLAGGVAHDFNNLLTIISGYSDIILSTVKRDDPIQEFAKEIIEAAERAASLTRQLLAFSRKAVLDPKVLDLNEVVRETGKMLRRLIGEDILLTTVFDPTISRVKVDPDQLGQVLMNLTVNARDAMPRGGNLTVETKAVELDKEYARLRSDVTPGKYVLISVSDSGFGMTPKVKARLFEPFFTTKGVGKGTGLGLAVVMGIVKQSGGHVAVYSEPDHGTTFKLYFPAVEELVDEAKPQSLAETMRGTETVLLVEDEEGVRGLAFMVLQSRGYKVLAATDGKDALRVVARHPGSIDILVTDVVMPGMGGRELAETLQPRYPQMKVLYTSGYTDDAVVRHGIVQAESAFLQKPYTPLSLSKKVRQVLEQR